MIILVTYSDFRIAKIELCVFPYNCGLTKVNKYVYFYSANNSFCSFPCHYVLIIIVAKMNVKK